MLQFTQLCGRLGPRSKCWVQLLQPRHTVADQKLTFEPAVKNLLGHMPVDRPAITPSTIRDLTQAGQGHAPE